MHNNNNNRNPYILLVRLLARSQFRCMFNAITVYTGSKRVGVLCFMIDRDGSIGVAIDSRILSRHGDKKETTNWDPFLSSFSIYIICFINNLELSCFCRFYLLLMECNFHCVTSKKNILSMVYMLWSRKIFGMF